MLDLFFTLLRFAYLIILWVFVALVIRFAKQNTFKKSEKKSKKKPVNNGAPKVLEVTSGSMKGASIPLSKTGITIGRNSSSTLVLQDSFVSYNHARIFLHDNAWYVEDLGSTNGTMVNSKKLIGAQKITAKDKIAIGKNVMHLN